MYDVISFGFLIYVMIIIMFQAADLKAPIDDRVNAHIKKLASENITNTNEIQRNVNPSPLYYQHQAYNSSIISTLLTITW